MGSDARRNPQSAEFTGVRSQTVYDARGCPLTEGDAILTPPDKLVVWKVQEIKPILDPRAPAGAAQVTIIAIVGMPAVYGQAVPVIKCEEPPEEEKPS